MSKAMDTLLGLIFLFVMVMGTAAAPTQFDYFLLTHQWGPNFCETEKCKQTPFRYFTIHGLWPQRNSGNHPRSCTDDLPGFDAGKLTSKVSDVLKLNWPSYVVKPDPAFWASQWNTHGKCSNIEQTAYFDVAVQRFKTHNVYDILKKAGITPRSAKPYKTVAIFDAIKKATNLKPILNCKLTLKGKQKVLVEVSFCLDKTATKFQQCPGANYAGCGTDIFY